MDIKKNTKIKIINKDKKNGGMLQQLLAWLIFLFSYNFYFFDRFI
jgi:hypothetical protein